VTRAHGTHGWRARSLGLALALLAASSCARQSVGNEAEFTDLVPEWGTPSEAYGAGVHLRSSDGSDYYGELMACDAGYLYFAVRVQGTLFVYWALPWTRLELAEARAADDDTGSGVVLWTILGTLSSGTHGALFLISFPVWLATGIPSSIYAGGLDTVGGDCDALRAYARFPQGLPPSIYARFRLAPSASSATASPAAAAHSAAAASAR